MKTFDSKKFPIRFSFFRGLRLFAVVPVLFLMASPISAQSYYPGGLGNSNLLIWLNAGKPTSITQNGAGLVSEWADLSGSGNHFGQSTLGNAPVYNSTGGPNSRPALTFTSTSSQYLYSLSNLSASISFTAGVSSFAEASFNAPQTAQGWQRIYDFGNGQASDNFMMGRLGSSANLYYEGWNGGSGDQTWTTSNPIVNGSASLYEAVQQGGPAGSLTAVSHFVAGTSQANSGQAGSSETWVPNAVARTSNYLGRSNWASDNYFSGTMSEILIYTAAFNTTQRVIMENYLSAEWGQTINTSEYSTPTATTYGTNLVGIGYTSASDYFLSDVAGSTDGLGFSSTNTATGFLNTPGYIMAAHNGQANTTISNASVPGISSAGSLTLWNRSWDVQKVGGNSTGQLTLNFNFSDYNGTTPGASAVYALIYNATDGSFATGTNQLITTTGTSVSGNIVSFTVNAANLVNGYYSILYSPTAIVLPIILTDFQAAREGTASLLGWSLSGASDVAEFDVERSTDGVQFTTIGTVTGNTSDGVSEQYGYTDTKPADGVNYYRLKISDLGGSIFYSGVRSVDFAAGTAVAMTVYPNPATDLLHISLANSYGTTEVLVVSSRGQTVRTAKLSSAGTLDIPVNDLAAGVYFVRINNGAGVYVREIMKK